MSKSLSIEIPDGSIKAADVEAGMTNHRQAIHAWRYLKLGIDNGVCLQFKRDDTLYTLPTPFVTRIGS